MQKLKTTDSWVSRSCNYRFNIITIKLLEKRFFILNMLIVTMVLNVSIWCVSGHHREPLEWSARQKIAVGAARGLRYLHEECRVGCIVHRDMRPNNILITHDFEPLVCKLLTLLHGCVFWIYKLKDLYSSFLALTLGRILYSFFFSASKIFLMHKTWKQSVLVFIF